MLGTCSFLRNWHVSLAPAFALALALALAGSETLGPVPCQAADDEIPQGRAQATGVVECDMRAAQRQTASSGVTHRKGAARTPS